ncbi:MAG: hypothetical protein Kow0080_16780 [Candidatus Promineifilaceae bacterium]
MKTTTHSYTSLFRRLFLLWLLCLFLLPAPFATAQETPQFVLTVTAGYNSYYKENSWIPVHITAVNDGPPLEGKLQITTGSSFGNDLTYEAPISLPTRSNKQITLYVYLEGFVNNLKVELVTENGQVAATAVSSSLNLLHPDDRLYAIVSPEPEKLAFLETITGLSGRAGAAFLSLDELPTLPAAWHTIDTLIISNTDTSTLTSKQIDALRGWVDTGGLLIITGGSGWQQTTAVFTEWLPVTPNSTVTVDDLPALPQFTGEPFRDSGPYLVTDSTLAAGGELLLHQDGLPLLAFRQMGKGGVFFLALDPALAPLRDWDGNSTLWQEVFQYLPTVPRWADGVQNLWSASSAVSRLPTLALPSTLSLVFFTLVYTIIIGPINYMVLKKRGQLEKAWLTIPALVVLFTAVSYFTGFQLRGNEVIINQMNITYGAAGTEEMRTQTLLGVYSPRRARYDLQLPENVAIRPFSPDVGNNVHMDSIIRSNSVSLHNVQIDIGEVATFIADTAIQQPDISGEVKLITNNQALNLEIRIRNNSDITLQTASIMVAGTVIGLGDIPPGEEVTQTTAYSSSASASSPTGTPLFVPSSFSGSPLMENAHIILGTADYYDDPDIYPRWELLQALDTSSYGPMSSSISTNSALLIAWSDETYLPVSIEEQPVKNLGTTLYFLEIPFERTITQSSTLSLPLGLLNWWVIDQNNVYDASPQEFYLGNGQVTIEYQPWPDFQGMEVTSLAIVLNSPDASYNSAPRMMLWNWEKEVWDVVEDGDWGETAVPDYGRYLDTDNRIRIQLDATQNSGSYITEVYPLYTGNLTNK